MICSIIENNLGRNIDKMTKILSVGMMVCDTILSPVPSNILALDSVNINRPVVSCGGDALNVAMGLSRLGVSTSIAGRISNDGNGKFIIDECIKNNIDITNVIYDDEPTASSYALVDNNGERHFLSHKTIFDKLSGDDISNNAIQDADIIYFGSIMAMKQMNFDGVKDIFVRAHSNGKLTAMDAAINLDEHQKWLEFLKPAFMETDVFFPSLEEAKIISGKEQISSIVDCFREFNMKIFGIKLGNKGSYVTNFSKEYYISCPDNIQVVDTTGAGDSFMAGLLCGLLHQWNIYESTRFATFIASMNVSAVGGTAGIPSFDKAIQMYQNWIK